MKWRPLIFGMEQLQARHLLTCSVCQVVETLDLARHYACSMDIHSSHQALYVCGVAKVRFADHYAIPLLAVLQ